MFKTKLSLLLLIASVFTLNVFAQDEAEKQGKEIYEKYQAALGGKENLDKIKTVEKIYEMEAMGTKKKQTVIEDNVTNKRYSVTEGGIEGKQESGFDGSRYWVKNNSYRGYRDMNAVSNISRKLENYRKLPNETIDGKEYFVLESKDKKITSKTYYDVNTYLLARTVITGESSSGNSINQIMTQGDYRKVGDVMVPFFQTFTLGPGLSISQKYLSIRHNIEVDPKIFEFSDGDKKVEKNNTNAEKKEDKSLDQAMKQPKTLTLGADTIFKDENGNKITQTEFMQKQSSGNYQIQPIMADGKVVGISLKKGGNETEIGATPPDFNAALLDSSPVQLRQLRGKVVVLNFWFIECAPCIKEMPELNELVKKYEDKEVEFLAITYNSKDQITEFLKKRQFDYKQIVDAQNIIDSYKATAFPTHIVIDREGKIQLTQFGYQTGIVQKIGKTIDESLAKPAWDKKNSEALVPDTIKKETFDKVWQIINDTHFDPTFNGVDWKAVKTTYEPNLASVKTNGNLTDFLNKMVGELKQSHIKIIPANQIAVNQPSPEQMQAAMKTGSIGVGLRLLNKSEIVVTTVREKSPAEQTGIKKGWLIKKIDGQTVESIWQKEKEKGGFQLRDEIAFVRAVAAKLAGEIDKKVSVTVVDENDTEKILEIGRQNFGMSRDLTFESKELNADVGYIKFNIFMGDLPKKFEEAIITFQNKRAVIVDLRGNPGGVGNHTTAIAAMLDKEKRSLGVSQYRYNKQEFEYEGNDKSFKGKVFILMDEMSGSSAEVLAGGLQANKRAIIVGQNSAGAVLPATIDLLPNGSALQHAIGDFKTPDGKILEGKGVTPDVEVKLNRQDLLAGKDSALEATLKLVNN